MASLYEYVGDFKMLQDMIDDEAVTVEDVIEALKVIESNIETKVENISWLIKEYTSKAEMFKKEEKRLNERRKTYENKVDSLKNYLLLSLDALNVKKIEAGTFTVRKQKNPISVKVVDENLLDEKYLTPQPSKVNSKAIKEDLDNGVIVEGATYAPESYHIRIQ